MKVGSLVERRPDGFLVDQLTGKIVEGMSGKIPKGVPLVISGWNYGHKSLPDLFYLTIEGYEMSKDEQGVIRHEWYSPKLFIELQPPMDLGFIEEMQMPVRIYPLDENEVSFNEINN